jgi:hypothetical protein
MSALPSIGISPAPSNKWDTAAHRLGDLLDTLIALRMDVGHGANGIAASPPLGPEQMREVRVLLDCAIASTKEIFDSIHLSPTSDVEASSSRDRRATPKRTAEVGQTPSLPLGSTRSIAIPSPGDLAP